MIVAAERRSVLNHVVLDESLSCGVTTRQFNCAGRHVRGTVLQGLALGCEALPSSHLPGSFSVPLRYCTLTVLMKAPAELTLVRPLVWARRRVAARRVEGEAQLNLVLIREEHNFNCILVDGYCPRLFPRA